MAGVGCAGLAPALQATRNEQPVLDPGSVALVIASQCISVQTEKERLELYRRHSDPWAWLTQSVFGDGVAAMVSVHAPDNKRRGLPETWSGSGPDHTPVTYPGGGSAGPTTARTLAGHAFLMDAPRVGKSYVKVIQRSVGMLEARWAAQVVPVIGEAFDRSKVKRFYLHQSNLRREQWAAQALGLDPAQMPTNMDRVGKTPSPSALLLLEDDLRTGAVKEGDLVVFLLVGA